MSILSDLNTQQKAAVTYDKGPLLVLAGAGSGKTKVLTHRVAYFIDKGLVKAENCLLMTFTNKASGEMKERIVKLINQAPGFAGTFHSLCAKILRVDGRAIGIPPGFLIYDESDQKQLVKEIIENLGYSTDSYNPGGILSAISDAKNQMLSPTQYSEFVNGEFQQVVFKVYLEYEKRLKEIGALDFDDLLIKAVLLLKGSPEILKKWQSKFTHIFVDEWQDTNKIQYALTKLLVSNRKNITAVGDASQCLPTGTLITTPNGFKKIEKIKNGDQIISATGRGLSEKFLVNKIYKRSYQGKIVALETASGKILRLTPNHILFAKLTPKENLYHVYLMYKKDVGFRIGQAKGSRSGDKFGHKSSIGIATRGNQESADKMWVLKSCITRSEANYWEYYFAFKYGIPTLIFHTSGRSMQFTQQQVNRLFSEIDTAERASKLMSDLNIDPRFPHHRPKGTSGNKSCDRQIVHLKFFENPRITNSSPWCAHRISLNTTDRRLETVVKNVGFFTRNGRRNTWRTEITRVSYNETERIAQKISKEAGNIDISYEAFLLKGKGKLFFHPASHIQPGMVVGYYNNKAIVSEEIKSVKNENFRGNVYDLDIDNVHNYIANGVAVHNSIYSWRGADYRNINYLIKDYSNIKIVNLEQNYRSTQNILEAANFVISKNTTHPILKLWTEKHKGEKIKLYTARNGLDEADFIVNEVNKLKRGKFNYSDIAVLYRTNAQSRVLEEALLHEGIPYMLVGGTKFYDRKEVKDVLSYLRLLINPKDSVSRKRIEKLGVRKLEKFREFQKNFGSVEGKTTLDILDLVLEKTGYLDLFQKESEENLARLENIKELRSVATEFRDINEFLENVALVEAEQTDSKRVRIKGKSDKDAITLMTLHAAKGLEFPIVFIVGMEEGLFPHSRSLWEQNQLEEERRLAYVGITRAKETLYLSYASRRIYFGEQVSNPPSRFIVDIPENLLENVGENIYKEAKKKKDYFDLDDGKINTNFEGVFDDIIEKYLK